MDSGNQRDILTTRQNFLVGFVLCIFIVSVIQAPLAAETLYNGITLTDKWPPQIKELTRQPMQVPICKIPRRSFPLKSGGNFSLMIS